ncbi:MAG: DNA polymerase IV [Spirochaetes bacterium]|jgi:DNA polymerase-4|nr:DNA polymerase IV [Spirochaetota bacterium]
MSHEPLYFHVDLDAFYASVEQLDTPAYRGKPVVVGAKPGSRGVVSACSYEARRFGIHSAMPISEAYRRCAHAVFLPVRMDRYHEMSRIVMTILANFTPHIQQISVDEAFLDMTGTERIFGPPEQAAMEIKRRIREETGLAITVGGGSSRYIAKLASAYDKPDGRHIVPPGEEESFVGDLDLDNLWGLGRKTLGRLKAFNITTVAELKALSKPELRGYFGEASGEYLYRAARGVDPGTFAGRTKSHSLSSERTFQDDVANPEAISGVLLSLAHEVMFRVMADNAEGRTVQVKYRSSNFDTKTARRTLAHPVSSGEELYEVARELLFARWDGRTKLRLLGVGVSGVEPEGSENQGELFVADQERRREVEKAVLALKQKFKGTRIEKARFINRGGDSDAAQ